MLVESSAGRHRIRLLGLTRRYADASHRRNSFGKPVAPVAFTHNAWRRGLNYWLVLRVDPEMTFKRIVLVPIFPCQQVNGIDLTSSSVRPRR